MSRLHNAVNRNTLYQNLAFAFCVLFGLAMIANTQNAGDGGWYWYAYFLHNGRRLYADMHLALQPLFVLETEAFLALLGKGWLVSKIPAVLHLVAYCFGMLLLVRHSRLGDLQKAILLGCAFFVSICFEAYRFDDYHVLADCFELYSLVILLALEKATSTRQSLSLVATLGVLSGLTLTTRINDGAALVVAVVIAILCLAPAKKPLSILLFGTVAALTLVIVVKLTGDSLHDYAMSSIFRAAGSKGGAGSVLAYPLHLPINTWRWLRDHWYRKIILYTCVVALSWVYLILPIRRTGGSKGLIKAALGLTLILLPLHRMYRPFLDSFVVITFSAVAVLVSYAMGMLILFRLVRWLATRDDSYTWDHREILLLIPLGQLASGSMSSAGLHLGLYGPIGVLLLILPIASPIPLQMRSARSVLLTIATLLLCSGAIYRARSPYSWHSYHSRPFFVGRQWYHHPDYGPMVSDQQLLEFIEPVCAQVHSGTAPPELLSLPFSFANYFCAVPPWHGYVQTFFDTSTRETIFGLMDELQKAPPKWIFYQRQLDNLKGHEQLYNHGQPLPHRYLDQLIEQKIDRGEWQTVYTSKYGNNPPRTNEWFLIRTDASPATSPPVPPEPAPSP